MSNQWNQGQPFEVEGSEMQPASNAVNVRSRMSAPAIVLMILAALGLLSSLYGIVSLLFIGPQMAQMSQQFEQQIEQQIERDMQRMQTAEQKSAEQSSGPGSGPEMPPMPGPRPGPDIKSIMQLQTSLFQGFAAVGITFSIIGLVANALIIFGAISMMNVQRYGLAITAAILTMLPITSPCCLIGLPAGIWALVALTRPGVSEAFRGR
jgi:hypothetical protein